jgi:Protein of unknown function (DUF4241)
LSDRPFAHHLAALIAAALITGCGGTFPRPREVPTERVPTPRPSTSFTVRADLDPRSACVLDPDPTNGGTPRPPAPVVEAGDPIDPAGVVEVSAVGLGDIVLPSSRLLVADFFFLGGSMLDGLPRVDVTGFTGRAPVCLHVARLEPADERAAFLHVRLLDAPVVRWVIGTEQFGVDGGTGGIASVEAVRAVPADFDGQVYIDALDAHNVNTWSWANIATDPASGANVIGFSTGYGDGGYPVYSGIDRDGRVVSIVIDLLVLPWRWLGRIGTVTRS